MEMNEEVYCRRLGHHLPLSYCLAPGQKRFCSSFRNCWFSRMDVDAFLSERFSPEEIEAALAPSLPRITGLVSVLEKLGALPEKN